MTLSRTPNGILIMSLITILITVIITPIEATTTYVNPDMNARFPILAKYCTGSGTTSDDYHCKNLARLLFRAANIRQHGHDEYFTMSTKGIFIGYQYTREDIVYHMKNLLNSKERMETIIDLCHEFEEECVKYCPFEEGMEIQKSGKDGEDVVDDVVEDVVEDAVGEKVETDSKAHSRPKFITPDMNAHFPILSKYCSDPSRSNEYAKFEIDSMDYHCNNLRRLLFRAANIKLHGEDEYFNEVTAGVFGDYGYTKSDIKYHVNNLLKSRESPDAISDLRDKFEQLCESYCSIDEGMKIQKYGRNEYSDNDIDTANADTK